ncbi:MAG: MFS transporter [Hyphomicrobiales bacterium]|nr:MFS transporter [Hyphomicrobiales bacterium]MCP5371157.1 MFS transporter [Hyphomicrobiales bacterium]
MPVRLLLMTLAMQTLATMAVFSLPTAAPEIARDLGIDAALVGFFVSAVYAVGIGSAVLSPSFIHRYGAVRVGQFVMVVVLGMLALAGAGSLPLMVLSAVVLGIGYGATAPVSTHLLVPNTPPAMLNFVLSLRQIGVPLGGVLAALVVPPLALALDWNWALWLQLVPAAALLAVMQRDRRRLDAGRDPAARVAGLHLLRPLGLLRDNGEVRGLAFACFFYAGIQLCFIAFMVVHLTTVVGLGLVAAGQALAAYQVSGVLSRPVWGWIADRWVSARRLLALQGLVMAGAALAAGWFAPGWPLAAVWGVAIVAGATASGFTGIAYGEFARAGGAQRTEATAVGSAAMFAGVMILPSAFSAAIAAGLGYPLAYAAAAVLAAVSGALLFIQKTQSKA